MHDPQAVDLRRKEFGAFLRSRRERLIPREVGLPAGGRRRTPGLRREEVALLAGVGTTWYTWLEQGRPVRPSHAVLRSLGDVLKLSPDEKRYLYALSGQDIAAPVASVQHDVPEGVQRLLAAIAEQPACVIDGYWNVLAWNMAAEAAFGDYSRIPREQRNILYLLFADPSQRELLVDWAQAARESLAMFRCDSSHHAGEPAFQALVSRLEAASPEFRRWWPRREVVRPTAATKQLNHQRLGRVAFERLCLNVEGQPELRLLVYLPLRMHDTDLKLRQLLIERAVQATACEVVA